MVGQTISHYKVLEKVGEGGMGEVYRATDTKLNRDVALKVLPEAFAQDQQRIARFAREAQVLASLNHPNIATIHGLEEADGKQALVPELAEGEDLAEPACGLHFEFGNQLITSRIQKSMSFDTRWLTVFAEYLVLEITP